MLSGNEHPLKDILRKMVAERRWDQKLHETRIREFWTKRMGTTINQYTRDIKLRYGKLYITLESSPVKQELSYEKDKLRLQLNKMLGEEVVKIVVIR